MDHDRYSDTYIAGILGDGAPQPEPRRVASTLDRADLALAQTPQLFERSLIDRAYENPDPEATDDASLVEALGEPVLVVEGDPRNAKITTPADLRALGAMLGLKGPAARAAHKRF